jgi:hypothetical protein
MDEELLALKAQGRAEVKAQEKVDGLVYLCGEDSIEDSGWRPASVTAAQMVWAMVVEMVVARVVKMVVVRVWVRVVERAWVTEMVTVLVRAGERV